ncbi:MAG TPA: IS481 family transposase [Microthrixaceae bacterium]|nr:IS481 family transposase [Microthrixaceae bacterium]MCB9400868.1 IS481 family transposase [Microthrixaceae bacterium]MCO5307504.1 IS481 family transposase [Microthrixaceae bacterium]HRW39912.1 IS481 family transposase [Microthrixaceae bacterium]
MSKNRLVITAVITERRPVAEVAATYGVSRSWIYELLARHRTDGDTAFQPRSKRPKSSPTATTEATVELIIATRTQLVDQGLDAGATTIAWHLQHHHQLTVSTATIWRHLRRAGLIEPAPKKRPKSSYIRFQADQPNECWQSDFTHWRLADRTDIEVLAWLDDHSRFVLSLTAHRPVTGPAVVDTFTRTVATHGIPASTLTDNGLVYTARFAGGRGGRNAFETLLAELGVAQKNSKPNHPTTCGKVERFHQTLKQWLTRQPQAATIDELQAQLDTFVEIYNHQRPHRSLPNRATPATIYTARPKATPTPGPDGHHHRVRVDRVDTTGKVTLRHNGRLHHIGIGRTHARTHVLLLVDDLDIRVIDAATGELLRALELDPTRDYQPTGLPRSRKRTTPRP